MKKKEFDELFNKKEFGLLLLDGGVNLSKTQLKKLKEASKEQSEQKLQQMTLKMASEPGYANSVLMPVKKKLIDELSKMMVNIGKDATPKSDTQKPIGEETQKEEKKSGAPEANLLGQRISSGNSTAKQVTKVSNPKSAVLGEKKADAAAVLGEIYKQMQLMEEDKKLNDEMVHNHLEEEEHKKNKRNEEIIKALTGRNKEKPKRKRGKKVIKEKKEAKKEEVPSKSNRPSKQTETPRVENVKPQTPGPTPKPELPSIPKGATEVAKTVAKSTAKYAAGAAIIGGLLMPSQSVASVIDKASETVGVDRGIMYAMAKQESSFNPDAAASTSSAKGLFQFINGTWNDTVKKYGSRYPILQQRNSTDPEANALAGALFIKDNSTYLAKSGIPINATNIYAAHFLGPEGARKLLSAEPNTPADKLLPAPASANKNIFYEQNGTARTVSQVVDVLFNKVGKYQQKYSEASSKNTGNTLNNISTENRDLKKDMNAQDTSQNLKNNTVVNQQTNQSITAATKTNDRSAMEQKSKQ